MRFELLAGDGRADDGEDARADHRANAQRGQRPRAERLFERVLRLLRVADQLVDRLAGKQLAGQGSSPRPQDCGALSMAGARRSEHAILMQDAFAAVYRMRLVCWKETSPIPACIGIEFGMLHTRRPKQAKEANHQRKGSGSVLEDEAGPAGLFRSWSLALRLAARQLFDLLFLLAAGSVRLALGEAFLRAARFSFLRSSLSSILVVSATDSSFIAIASSICPTIRSMRVLWYQGLVRAETEGIRRRGPNAPVHPMGVIRRELVHSTADWPKSRNYEA